jgi:primosomal protein N' (replication factor Y) (superfamily II helicase)
LNNLESADNIQGFLDLDQGRLIKVLLPLPFMEAFTYRLPQEMLAHAKPGSRVVVQFGLAKIYTGVILSLIAEPVEGLSIKSVLALLDEEPVLNSYQLKFLERIAGYYLANRGDVLQAALPAGLKLSSGTVLYAEEVFDPSKVILTPTEDLLFHKLRKSTLTYAEACKWLKKNDISQVVKALVRQGAIRLQEELEDKYSPALEQWIYFNSEYQDPDAIEALIEALAKKPRQQDMVLWMMSQLRGQWQEGIMKSQLKEAGLSPSALDKLKEQEVLVQISKVRSRVADYSGPILPLPELKPSQQLVLDQIQEGFSHQKTVLLHGVTGSGKTEIYMHLISKALDAGMQVLYLLPEIALSTQITLRLQQRFGSHLGVYHSRFSDNERVELYHGLQAGRFDLVVGVRSSVFLPFERLGLIIIDEEHDSSYKQQDPAPRYHGRDAALMLANLHGAKVLLGSATPSAESLLLCKTSKWLKVNLLERYNDRPLPDLVFSHLGLDRREGRLEFEFGAALSEAIRSNLEKKQQTILFHNRRGYAHWLQCQHCQHIPTCKNCAVSLTYHQQINLLRCHYCGYRTTPPPSCPVCMHQDFRTVGYGTEQLDEHLQVLFPQAKIRRMDTDTTRGKHAIRQILEHLNSGETDILIGTQMVSKGLDVANVTLVGVINADRLLFFPDFRAQEHTFQTLMQVCGRAGRADLPGRVIVQTFDPEHEVYQALHKGDVEAFMDEQLVERKEFGYPPYTRLLKITIKHKDKETCKSCAQVLARDLAIHPRLVLLGPEEPPISRLKNKYLQDILIKIKREEKGLHELKWQLYQTCRKVQQQQGYRTAEIIIDVDPV